MKYAILASSATSALDDATKSLIQSGFDSLKATGTEVIGMAVVAAVGVVVLAAGVNFALKWIRGILNKAG